MEFSAFSESVVAATVSLVKRANALNSREADLSFHLATNPAIKEQLAGQAARILAFASALVGKFPGAEARDLPSDFDSVLDSFDPVVDFFDDIVEKIVS